MHKDLIHTTCSKCNKPIDLIMSPEERKAWEGGAPVHCEDCFDVYLAELYHTPNLPKIMVKE